MNLNDSKNNTIYNLFRQSEHALMKIKVMLLAVVICICTFMSQTVNAETVSQKEASRIAELFFNAANKRVMAKPKMVYNGRRLTTGRLFAPFYVYTLPTGGFVIISAENKAFPILGYSLKTSFDPDKLNETELSLLRGYARDIEMIRYDSRVPDDAIYAWTHIQECIASILNAPYIVTDLVVPEDTIEDTVEYLLHSDEASNLSSDLYSPSQWQEMMTTQLKNDKNTIIGIINNELVYPAVALGHKGDYFRLWLRRDNDWLMRLMPTEYLSFGQLANLSNAPQLPEPEEEAPFAFYDGFIAETRAAEQHRESMFEDILNPTEPVIRSIGGGHFEIKLPENVTFSRIYNIGGAMVAQHKFTDTDTAVIDISFEPAGFYAALFVGASGKTYGIKLYR